MILTSISEGINHLISVRAIQVIILSAISMTLCQILKFIIFSVKEKKMVYKSLITTGGMPSSHTASVTTLVISLGLFQYHDTNGLDYSFAVALVFAMIVIHDAMGVRLEASKHAKILNNLVKHEDVETKKQLGFGNKGYLKELLGHKGFEVIGGFLFGTMISLIGYFTLI